MKNVLHTECDVDHRKKKTVLGGVGASVLEMAFFFFCRCHKQYGRKSPIGQISLHNFHSLDFLCQEISS